MDHLGKYLLLALTIQGLVVDTCLACLPACLSIRTSTLVYLVSSLTLAYER